MTELLAQEGPAEIWLERWRNENEPWTRRALAGGGGLKPVAAKTPSPLGGERGNILEITQDNFI